jgi:hypothetical protein
LDPNSAARRKRSAAVKAERAVDLRNHGMSLADTARQVGFSNATSCNRAITRYLASHPAPAVNEMRVTEDIKLDLIESGLWKIIARVHWATTSRGLAYDADGFPVVDSSPNIQAYRTLVQVMQRRARLHGLDKPVSIRLIEDEEALDQGIEDLIVSLTGSSRDVPVPDGMRVAERDSTGYPVHLEPL